MSTQSSQWHMLGAEKFRMVESLPLDTEEMKIGHFISLEQTDCIWVKWIKDAPHLKWRNFKMFRGYLAWVNILSAPILSAFRVVS